MKKILSLAVILAAILLPENGFAQRNRNARQAQPIQTVSEQSNTLSTVSGVWNRRGSQVSLFQIISGRLEPLATYNLQADKTFGFAFTPTEPGFYVIGEGRPNLRTNKYIFFFNPGDRLNIVVNDTGFTLVGENSKENLAVKAWHDYILPLERMAFYQIGGTYVQFFPLLERTLAQPFVAPNTGNKAFEEAFATYRTFDFMHTAINFTMLPASVHPKDEDFPNYYRTLKTADFVTNADILLYPYNRLLPTIFFTENKMKGTPSRENPSIALIEMATNDTLRGELFLTGILPGIKDLQAMLDSNEKYDKFVVTEDQKRRFDQDVERINKLHLEQGPGVPGHNWTYKDANGNDVSFSDFKGKVVYIDVWATWCGPCIAEMPHKKRLKERYAGNKNIEFVSISTDRPADIQKWKDFIAANELTGIQLHGNIDGPSNIGTLYGITGIPRFLLFDKQGNIVNVNAPRPSATADLIPMIDRLLR